MVEGMSTMTESACLRACRLRRRPVLSLFSLFPSLAANGFVKDVTCSTPFFPRFETKKKKIRQKVSTKTGMATVSAHSKTGRAREGQGGVGVDWRGSEEGV